MIHGRSAAKRSPKRDTGLSVGPPREVPREQRARHRAQLGRRAAHEPVDAHELGEERHERRVGGRVDAEQLREVVALERVVAGVVEVAEAAALDVEVAG